MKKRTNILMRIIGSAALIPLLLIAWLQTPWGKGWAASELERRLSASEHLNVRIGTLRGWVPASVRIDRVEIGDGQGTWLTAEGVEARWRIRDLMDRRIRLTRIGAKTITFHRQPQFREREAMRPPMQLPEMVLDQLSIGSLRLSEGAAGRPLQYAVASEGIHLEAAGRLTGALQIEGDAVGSVTFSGRIDGAEPLRIAVQLDQLVEPALGMDQLSGHADVSFSCDGINGSVQADARRGALQGRAETAFSYAGRILQLPRMTFSGPAVSGEAAVSIDFSGDGWRVDLQSLGIRAMDAADIRIAGEGSAERLAFEGRILPFELSRLPISGFTNLAARVDGTVSLTGSLRAPVVQAGLEVLELASAGEALVELPALNVRVSGQLAGGQLRVDTVITNAAGSCLAADLTMPCAFSLDPFSFAPQPQAAAGRLSADIDLDLLNRLPLFADQRIEGLLEADLAYDRGLSGALRLERGTYEHFVLGVVVRDIDLDCAAVNGGVQINSATATDGADGRMVLAGGVVSNRLDLVFELSRAAVVRRDDLEAVLSGRIGIGGPLHRPEVTGKLTVNRAEILIGNIPPPLPPLLTDYDAGAVTQAVAKAASRMALPFGVDLELDLADQVYADASMISSVWGGSLRLQNTLQGLCVKGRVEPRRGYVSFIGKKFRFTGGRIDIDGTVPVMPSMNRLTAEYSRGGFAARLILNGRLDNPDYILESTPAMPEDEILAQVLFNRDASSITPYQAFQIASAARQLSGGLRGPGFMYQMRRAVGIDTLEWREGAEAGDASSVAAGKFVTPSLYIEINQALDARGETGMIAEYEITRHLSIETGVGAQMRPGIGVNWKNDY